MAAAEEDEQLRPTYFELAAAESLVPSLKAALSYSLSVLAQRRPGLHRLLDHEDEAFAALMLLVVRYVVYQALAVTLPSSLSLLAQEYNSLAASDASVGESFYGLRRAVDATPGHGLTMRQRWLALLGLVLVPYIKAKAEREYVQRRGGAAASMGLLDESQDAIEAPSSEVEHSRLQRAFMAFYPWLHAAAEGSTLVTGLAYVALGARTHSPLLALLRTRLMRARMEDVNACAVRTASARQAAVAAARSRRLGTLRVLLLQSCFGVVDAARPSLVAAVLGFKVLEWWFGTAEAALAPSKRLPVPPPPPPLPLAPGGLPMPADVRACPICLRSRTNTAVAAPSGIAFCFPCLRSTLDTTGLCPVTGVPVGADQVRRLFETAV